MIEVEGREQFLLGANYPWLAYGGDFGGNAWGSRGVHTGGAYASDFANLKARGVKVVRWYVFGDGRGGITYDAEGTPTGLHADTLVDLRAAVRLAEANDLYLVLVLFDFSLLYKPKTEDGVRLGDHTGLMTDPTKRVALVDRVVTPVVLELADEPRVLAWEIMNEPEWAISDLPEDAVNKEVRPMKMADFWAFASSVSRLVHTRTDALVTVGGASLKWVRVWTDGFAREKGLPTLGLDFYQVHYYPWMDGKCTQGHRDLGDVCWSPLRQDAAALGLDRPILVGEFEARKDVATTLDRLLRSGYAGALVWSYRTTDPVDWEAIRAWAASSRAPVP